jgi:ABC-type sugar transport system ATPase subunit
MHARTRALLDQLGLRLPPTKLVRNCRIAEQQLVEVAKALNLNLRILVMDEPTSALADSEVHRLFRVIHDLTAQNVGVIYISHRLEELEEIADSVTVLRDGAYVGHRPMTEATRGELVTLMVGRPLGELFPRAPEQRSTGTVVLEVHDLTLVPQPESGDSPLHAIDFQVRAGEIVGLAGLMGAGRTEVLESIYGAHGAVGGTITVDGKPYRPRNPRRAIRAGMALVAEDRKGKSLVLDNTVRFNTTLAALDRYRRPWRTVDRKAERAAVAREIAELLTKPTLLLLDEPTRGIDVGAKAEVHALMNALAEQGTAIIAVSSELPELIGMCDRVLVLCEGRLTGEFHRDADNGPVADQEAILTAAMARTTVLRENA